MCRRRVRAAPPTDETGQSYLVGGALLDGALNVVRVLNPTYSYAASVISRDGQYAYFVGRSSVAKMRLADGVLLERNPVPVADARWAVMADATTLLVLDQSWSGSEYVSRAVVLSLQ